MTLKESAICGLIQSFPVLLILVQKQNKCLLTPLVYKPPSPTPSPEYFAALEAILQQFLGQCPDGHGYGHSNPSYGHSYPSYGHSYPSYGHSSSSYGHSTKYGTGVQTYPYPVYVYKKGNLYNLSGNQSYHDGSDYSGYAYAPNQVHSTNLRYKVVVKKTRIGGKRRAEKLLSGFFNQDREERRYGSPFQLGQSLLNGAGKIGSQLTGILHFGRGSQDKNKDYVYPFNRPQHNRYPNEYYNPQYNNNNDYQTYPYNLNKDDRKPEVIEANDDNIKELINEAKSNADPGTIIVVVEEESTKSESNHNKRPISTDVPYSKEISNNPNLKPTENKKDTYKPSNTIKFPDAKDDSEEKDQITSKPSKPHQLPPAFEVVPEEISQDENGKNKYVPNNNQPNLPTVGEQIIFEDTKENNNNYENKKPGIPSFPPVFEESNDKKPGIPSIPPQDFEAPNGDLQNIPSKPIHPSNVIPNTNPELEDKNGGPTELPRLTPVPASQARNNNNFGAAGLFKETCTTVYGSGGACISLYDCPVFLNLLKTSKNNPEVVTLLRKAHCGFEGNKPKVCCPRASIPTDPPPTSAPIVFTPEPKTIDTSSVLPEPPVCGFSNASLSRVVGGVDAKLGDFPWMALLGYHPGATRWLCGGSLITSSHVLTASHCVHNHEDDLYIVRLGELDLQRDNEGATPIDVPIKQKIKHEDYSPQSVTNDIAILVLTGPVQFTSLIKPICIPLDSELRARTFERYTPIIAGWGDVQFRGPSSPLLQALQLPVVTNEQCKHAYRSYKKQIIDERVLCAGYTEGGKDACQGDSGGPLMQPIWDSKKYTTYFYQIGVVSFGKGCAQAGFPGVYTRVTNFVPWIERTVADTS